MRLYFDVKSPAEQDRLKAFTEFMLKTDWRIGNDMFSYSTVEKSFYLDIDWMYLNAEKPDFMIEVAKMTAENKLITAIWLNDVRDDEFLEWTDDCRLTFEQRVRLKKLIQEA